jgi:tetratricopeptide (TPR) repeat protein
VLTKAGPLSPRDRAIGAYATANGHQIRVVFDTGAFLSGMSLRAAARAGVTPASPGVVQTVGSTGFGDKVRRTWVAPFDSFALGGEEIRKTRLRISETELEGIDMLLGADFFLSHRILVSQSQQKIYFTYNGGPVFKLETAVQRADAAAPPGASDAAPAPAAQPSDEPKDADGFARRAAASMGRREPGPAIADLDRAIALSPEDGELYLRRAEAHQMNRQPVLAMADLDEGIRRKPDSPEALIHRAQLYFGQRDRARAEADLDAADKLKIDDPSVRLSIAGVYEGAGDYDAAIAEYDRWIHDHPRDGQLPQALNGACWDRAVVKRDLDHALQDCNAAVNMRPGAANILDSRGLVHLDRGEIDQAIADYSAALKIQPKQPLTLFARGVAKQKKGLKEAGDADIQAATALNPKIADQAKRFGIAAADAPSPGG